MLLILLILKREQKCSFLVVGGNMEKILILFLLTIAVLPFFALAILNIVLEHVEYYKNNEDHHENNF